MAWPPKIATAKPRERPSQMEIETRIIKKAFIRGNANSGCDDLAITHENGKFTLSSATFELYHWDRIVEFVETVKRGAK